MERVKYHEIKSTARDMVRTAWDIGCRALEGILVGKPAPRHGVDYSGKPEREVKAIQLVLDGFPQIERTDSAQLGNTATRGWDSEGNYHE